MKSLQNKYNLIKEGKGNKELFLKEARTMYPNVVTGAITFEQAIHNLSERGIINEGMVLISTKKPETPDWFKIFKENTEAVKSDLKATDKKVEEKEIAGYDYKDKSNNNNISTNELLTGYYVELKDPKNADKTESEIKKIVFKNLEKDPLHYVKDGAFGIKGIGYTEDVPGLGKTKEVTGKYKSSGMEPVKLNESKHSKEADLKIYKSELNMLNKIKAKGEKHEKRKAELEKKIADLTKNSNESLNEIGMFNDPIGYEKPKPNPKDQIYTKEYKGNGIYIIYKNGKEVKTIEGEGNANAWMNNQLRNSNESLNEGYGMSLADAMKQAYEESLNGYVQHVEDNGDGTFKVTDWYDSDNTVVSFEDGSKFNDRTDEYDLDEIDITGAAGSDEEDDWREGAKGINRPKTETLSEAKKRAIEKHLKEIEKLGEVAAYEYKANKVQEKIEELKNKLAMTESDDMKEMVDKKTVKEIKKDIALLEKKKKMYEAQKNKAAKKVAGHQAPAGDAPRPTATDGAEVIDESTGKTPVWEEAMKNVLKKKGL